VGCSFGVHILLVARADPNVRQNEKMIEAQSGAGCVKGLSTKGGWTALMWAAEKGHLSVLVRELVGHAQIDQRDGYGATALMYARTSGASTCAFALLKAGADKDAMDDHGETALMRSVKKMQSTSVRLLVSEGADANKIGPPKAGVGAVDETHSGFTPLMWAIERESVELVRLLVEPSLAAYAHAGPTTDRPHDRTCVERD
jgi:ankyrin repeat protein